jgi:hypothetical protein
MLTSEDDMYAKFALYSGLLDQFNKLAMDFIPQEHKDDILSEICFSLNNIICCGPEERK